MKNQYDISVMIGRFQPVHSAHIEIIKKSLSISEILIIVIGSDNIPRTPKNPFTSQEREQMILASLPQDLWKRIEFVRVKDSTYNTQNWVRTVQTEVSTIASRKIGWRDKVSTVLVGHHKDDSSFYLDMFPQWQFEEIELINDLHSTNIRKDLFATGEISISLPSGVARFLAEFTNTEEYKTLCDEFYFIKLYKEQWNAAPYPPTFVTVDAAVIQSGHILLVKRRASPGKGLYALPGGFLDPDETMEEGMIRELREETKLKVPEPVLKGCIRYSKIYDAPQRSLRGRTITNAFLIELTAGVLPKVKGSSDAEKAFWMPLNEFYQSQDKMFEDHYSIIIDLLGKL